MITLPILHNSVVKKLLVSGLLEFGPIVTFLLSFRYLHVYKATLILMVVTIISTVFTYRAQKRLPYLALYVALLTTIFGYLTLVHREPRFIQVRDTLYDITSALTLLTGFLFNVSFLRVAFHSVLPQTMRAWRRLTYAWVIFFLVSAVLNEYVRKTYSLGQWFDFKIVMVVTTLIYGCVVLYFFYEKEIADK
jgi:intracellular septation protein